MYKTLIHFDSQILKMNEHSEIKICQYMKREYILILKL